MPDTPELPPTDQMALPEDGFIWMTHPSRFGGKPIPVRTFVEDGTRYYVPFEDSATDFEWDERDDEWKLVAAPVASRATRPDLRAAMVKLSRALGHPGTVEAADGQSVEAALIELAATRLAAAPQGWKPTPENINALPEPIRQYVMELETLCDPAGIVRENMLLKDCNRGLQLMYRKAADAAPAASSPEAADERAAQRLADEAREHAKKPRGWVNALYNGDPCSPSDVGAWMQTAAQYLNAMADALASAPAGAGEGEQHAPVSPELDATMLWLGETRDSLRAMADRANQLLTAHCRAALAGEPAVAADKGRECATEQDCTQMPWCRIRGKCQRAASQDEQQEKQG